MENPKHYVNLICQMVGLPVERIEKIAEGDLAFEKLIQERYFWYDLLYVTYGARNPFNPKGAYENWQREGVVVPGHFERCEELRKEHDF